ncbi:MAG: S1C family serine protease [Candidatus Dormiibacterota bacterium]
MSTPTATAPPSQVGPVAPNASPALRLGAVAVVAAIVGVVVGGGAAYFLVKHFENSSPGQVEIRNVTTPGGNSTATLPALVTQLTPSLVEVIREPAAGSPVTSANVSSGFIATSTGLILTSEGAVAGASGVEVALTTGQLLPATIAAADPDTGVVVLQVSSSSLPAPLTFASSPPADGDVAIAISVPIGGSPSVDVGTVSTVGLTVTVPDLATASGETVIDGVLRTDTPQPVGSSGGPLVDSAGAVIGILTGDRMQPVDQGTSAAASGFALDGSAADQLVSSLIATGSGPHPIGLVCRWLNQASAASLGIPAGAQVISVDPGSAAAQAGIQVGDVVITVGGTPASGAVVTTYPSLSDYLDSLGAESQVPIVVFRDGANHQLSLTLPSP